MLLDESAPDHQVVLQCEVINGPEFVTMRYCLHSGVGMRDAYDQMGHIHGLSAVQILRQHLDAPSNDMLWEILNKYNESVVELSTYPFGLGVLGWNTLFWEVRNW